MPKDESFKEFIIDQLDGLAPLRCKAMFGGFGLYREDDFFGIIADGRLYLKTDEATRGKYTEQGMGPFRPSERQTLKRYYEVPVDVLESPTELVAWAREAADGAGNSRD